MTLPLFPTGQKMANKTNALRPYSRRVAMGGGGQYSLLARGGATSRALGGVFEKSIL